MSAAQSDNERPHIRVKGSDGEWHEIETKRRETGDPELDRLWRMSFGELEAILDDPEHPLHEKAGQVAREITEPLAEMAKEVLKPLVDSLPKFDVSALMPKVDSERAVLEGSLRGRRDQLREGICAAAGSGGAGRGYR